MSPNPAPFLQHIQREGYHPRSDKHSNALSLAIVDDLIAHCPKISLKAARGEIVYSLNFTLRAGTADWNVDLVLGPPEFGTPPPADGEAILRRLPSTVEIAIELKAVMTEHRKAVKNRKRDLEAHHEHVHNYNAQAIAGAVLIINAAAEFTSPTRAKPVKPTVHANPALLVEHCIAQLRSVAARGGSTGYGLEARCAIVLSTDNVVHSAAAYHPGTPPVGDPLHYDAFIRTICEHYTRRF